MRISRRSSGFRVLALAAGLVLLVACGSDGADRDEPAASEPTGAIVVSDAEVPESPAENMAAAYFTILNDTDTDDALIEVAVDGAGGADLHRTEVTDDGLSRMISLERVGLPAGETITFEPGGLHVMIDEPPALTVGETITITLTFENAAEQKIDARIVEPGADDHHDHHDHGDDGDHDDHGDGHG